MTRLVLVAVGLLAAGCIAPTPEDVAPAALQAASTGAKAAWWDVPVIGGPTGALTSFWWTVPEDGPVDWAWNEEFGADETVIAAEASLVLPEGVEASRWAVFAFRPDEGKLWPAAAYVAIPFQVEMREGFTAQPDEHAPEALPFFIHLAYDAEPGDRLGIVVALDTPEPVDARFAFRLLDEDFDHEDEPAEDAKELLGDLAGLAPATVPLAGQGVGLHAAEYFEFTRTTLLPWGFEARGGDVVVDAQRRVDARPVAESRILTLSSGMEAASGWTGAFGMAFEDAGAGKWAVDADLHGNVVQAGGRILPSWGAGGLLGYPVFMALGEGDGPMKAAFTVDTTGPASSMIAYSTLGLGATLTDLLGQEAAVESWTGEGWLPAGAAQGAGALRVLAGGAEYAYAVPQP